MLQTAPLTAGERAGVRPRLGAFPAAVAAVAAVVALMIPMLVAGPSHLSSDESLYLAEAYNIAHGEGFTYPSGDPITHRAPLYPLLLAPAVRAGGADAAYAIPKVFAVVNALLVMWLAWRIGGAIAGSIAGLAAAASAYLAELGTTLYLDPAQCTFLLLSVIALHEGLRSRRLAAFVAGGALSGAGFLAKESAVQWAPLGLVIALGLPSFRDREGLRGGVGFTAAFAAVIAPWWLWVYAASGELFLMGAPSAAHGVLALALAPGFAAAIWAWRRPAGWSMPARQAVSIGLVMVIGWSAFLLAGLTMFSTWPYPNEYATSIPRYMWRVAPQMQPYLPILVAWAWVCWRAVRGDEEQRLLVIAAGMFVPFSLFAANRWLQLRDALPLVYLSYVVLGVAAADAWSRARPRLAETGALPVVIAAACGIVVAFAVHQALAFNRVVEREDRARAEAGSWDSPYTREVALWLETNVPSGSRIVTSRLYFSSLHVQTQGRYEIRQLPTVRVSIDPARDPMLMAESNLFRWGEGDVREAVAGDTWLHLQQFPGKGYWVGLGQQELLEYLAAHGIEYVVLTGEDVAFSSSAHAGYLASHPAFTLLGTITGTGGDRMFGFAVDQSKLTPVGHATSISPRSYEALRRLTGLDEVEFEGRLRADVRVTDEDGRMSERELQQVLRAAGW